MRRFSLALLLLPLALVLSAGSCPEQPQPGGPGGQPGPAGQPGGGASSPGPGGGY